MQTILGAGGAIGTPLAKELANFTNNIRLVSRHPKLVNPTDHIFPADLTNREQVFRAIEGSEVVYVTVGFEYSVKVWRALWPPFIRNVIDACKQNNAKLVFFDNVYMYPKNSVGHMTEDNPINPQTKKGQVRAQLVNMIMDEVKAGTLTAMIARAADFYGPNCNGKSILMETVYANMMKGKTAQWFGNADKKHNFTFTPDAGKAVALLGNTPNAYNQVWHLPTTHQALTGKQWAALFAKQLDASPKLSVLPAWLLGIIGLFVPIMGEIHEMAYQYTQDYVFDSSKFEQVFKFTPTDPEEGVRLTIEAEN
jgi:nucleoside-diphosphate-sugar epimerase